MRASKVIALGHQDIKENDCMIQKSKDESQKKSKLRKQKQNSTCMRNVPYSQGSVVEKMSWRGWDIISNP
jgi:hypothetical protein